MKVYFFGDSICFGQYVSPHSTWVTRISERLQSAFGEKIIVQNPSISGNTTRMALERMPHDVSSHAPDLLFIQFGMNDCNYWLTDAGVPRVSPQSFEANLAEMIDRAAAVGTRHILLATNHPSTRTASTNSQRSYQEGNDEYNSIIRAVAKGHLAQKGGLVDNDACWRDAVNSGTPLSDLLLADEIHLSPQGHDLYLQFVYPIVAKAVQQLL